MKCIIQETDIALVMLNGEPMELTVLKVMKAEIEVSRSRFLAYIFPCASIEGFEEKLNKIKQEHNHAKHCCYAYRIQESMLLERYQDDKEPSGTAGIPILEVLKGNGLTHCAIIVIRYFGGIKLGTGGLSRAYSDAAREVVKSSSIVQIETGCFLTFEIDYGISGKLEYFLATQQIAIESISYEAKIRYAIIIPEQTLTETELQLTELASGQILIECTHKRLGCFSLNTFTPFEAIE